MLLSKCDHDHSISIESVHPFLTWSTARTVLCWCVECFLRCPWSAICSWRLSAWVFLDCLFPKRAWNAAIMLKAFVWIEKKSVLCNIVVVRCPLVRHSCRQLRYAVKTVAAWNHESDTCLSFCTHFVLCRRRQLTRTSWRCNLRPNS